MTQCEVIDCQREAVRTWGGRGHCIPCMPPMMVTAYEVAVSLIETDAKAHPRANGDCVYSIRWGGKFMVEKDTDSLRIKLQARISKGGNYRRREKK